MNRDFTVQNSNNDQNANFVQLYPATIRNTIDDLIIDGEIPVEFNDPWYVKDQYDNQSGMSDFISFESPYYPTGKYNQTSGGVFLNQLVQDGIYYSIQTPFTQDHPLTQTGRTHKFYFLNWSATGGASLQQVGSNPPGYDQKAVVFSSGGATVTANLKGTQLSNDANAYTNSQRKFVKSDDGYLHQVYQSLGHVWYKISYNGGESRFC